MTKLSRSIVCAVLLCGVSTAPAASVAPNVQVNVKQGRTKLFTGVTDGSGRFTTVPLQPGVYTFELRALKTAPPAQYFLLLSGAKPVSTAMADKKAVLMMDAQVRTPRSVTGQVTARRLRIATPEGAAAAPAGVAAPVSAATPAAAGTAAAPARTAVAVQPATASRVAAQPQMATPRQAAPSAAASATGLAPRPVGYQTKMINGRPHIWMPIAPGSTLGRWVPGRP